MKKITTALLSYGMSGKVFHAPFVHAHPGFELVGSWERSRKLLASDYPGTKSYETLESLLNDDGVELVVVNTPTYTHYDYSKKALQAGKHIVVEKAFTCTSAEARELIDISRERKLLLSVFQNRRWDSDFMAVRKVVEDGLLGDIVEATFSYDRYNPELSPKAHKETPGRGAGVVYDLGPHLIDQALLLFGFPQSVFADIMTTRTNSQVPDYFEIILFYKSLRVRLHSGYFVRESVPSFAIHGKNGSFLKSRADVQEAQLQKGMKPNVAGYGQESESQAGLLHTIIDGEVVRTVIKSPAGNYLLYYDGVQSAIRYGSPVEVSGEDGERTIRIIEASYRSSKERMIVDL